MTELLKKEYIRKAMDFISVSVYLLHYLSILSLNTVCLFVPLLCSFGAIIFGVWIIVIMSGAAYLFFYVGERCTDEKGAQNCSLLSCSLSSNVLHILRFGLPVELGNDIGSCLQMSSYSLSYELC